MILSNEFLDDTRLWFMPGRFFCEFNFNDQNVQDSIYKKY